MEEGILGLVLGMGALFFIVTFAIVIAAYVLMSLGLMTMAKNKGIENAWLAWVPVGNLYILGCIIETIEFADKKIEKAGLILAAGSAAMIILSAIPVIGQLLSLAFLILYWLCVYKLYKMYAAEKAVMYLVLSIIFAGIAMPIIFFKLKDVTPVDVV